MTTICLHGKWHSSASYRRIFTKIAAFESRDQVESQRCGFLCHVECCACTDDGTASKR